MKRKIISIDEAKCNGCGKCVTGCAEGALQIVNGKARLVKDQFCDGFGDCIGECPTGALTIVEKDAAAFDVAATKQNLMQTQGSDAVRRMDAASAAHERGEHSKPPQLPAHGHGGGGCPGSRMRFSANAGAQPAQPASAAGAGHMLASDLQQWPVQIHLVPPGAPFFAGRELVVLSTCAPVASADVHWRFIRGRGVAVGCPKLDRTDGYAEKLGAILRDATIPKVIVVRMEVPCCGGLTAIVREAVRLSGRTDLVAEEVTLAVNGDLIGAKPL
jgi:Pyruvate/2-oxoacid:ferredoxin oxidoreductase delta subunit